MSIPPPMISIDIFTTTSIVFSMRTTNYISILILVFFAQSLTPRVGSIVSSQPVVLPNYNLLDINRVNISPNGKLLIRGNLGGNFRLYSLSGPGGSKISDYARDEDSGEYYVMPFFSQGGRYNVLNSALQANDFADLGRLHVIDTHTNTSSLTVNTKLRGFVGTNFTNMNWPSIFDFSADETMLAYTDNGKNLIVYDLAGQKQIVAIALNEPYYTTAITFHPSGKFIATKSGDKGQITLWEIATKKQIAVFTDPNDYDMSDSNWLDEKTVRFSNDGRYLITFSTLNYLYYVWDVSMRRLIIHDFFLTAQIRSSPANNFMAIGNIIFNQQTKKTQTLNIGNYPGYVAVAFSPDDKFIALTGGDGIYVFDTSTFTQVGQAPLPGGRYVSAMAFSDTNNFYAVSSSGQVSYVSIHE